MVPHCIVSLLLSYILLIDLTSYNLLMSVFICTFNVRVLSLVLTNELVKFYWRLRVVHITLTRVLSKMRCSGLHLTVDRRVDQLINRWTTTFSSISHSVSSYRSSKRHICLRLLMNFLTFRSTILHKEVR